MTTASLARSDLEAALARLAPEDGDVRRMFCLACVERVAHLLERAEALEALAQFRAAVLCKERPGAGLRDQASALARSHAGSRSIDGTGHASVSATHALARAVAGDPLGTADYAAYAATYSYGGYAVQDPDAFDPEYRAQLQSLRQLTG